jgi:uncharacterized protein (TIGR02996 family)
VRHARPRPALAGLPRLGLAARRRGGPRPRYRDLTELVAEAYGDGGGSKLIESAARTGCVGCNLASRDVALERLIRRPEWAYLAPLKRLRPLYAKLKLPRNRLRKPGGERRKDGSLCANQNRMGPLTFEARRWGLDRVLAIQAEVCDGAAATGKPPYVLIDAEEEARILELIDAADLAEQVDRGRTDRRPTFRGMESRRQPAAAPVRVGGSPVTDSPLASAEWAGLVASIRFAPDDDTARLVAAEWLDDTRRPELEAWAELIRVQVAAAHHSFAGVPCSLTVTAASYRRGFVRDLFGAMNGFRVREVPRVMAAAVALQPVAAFCLQLWRHPGPSRGRLAEYVLTVSACPRDNGALSVRGQLTRPPDFDRPVDAHRRADKPHQFARMVGAVARQVLGAREILAIPDRPPPSPPPPDFPPLRTFRQ